jgi:hypothetical protein
MTIGTAVPTTAELTTARIILFKINPSLRTTLLVNLKEAVKKNR